MQLKPIGDHSRETRLCRDCFKVRHHIPDTVSKERPERGEVIAVGPGRLLENGMHSEMTVNVGAQVVFKKYSPDEIKLDDVEFLVIRMEDVMAVLE